MKKFKVDLTLSVDTTVEIEAQNKEFAESQAEDLDIYDIEDHVILDRDCTDIFVVGVRAE